MRNITFYDCLEKETCSRRVIRSLCEALRAKMGCFAEKSVQISVHLYSAAFEVPPGHFTQPNSRVIRVSCRTYAMGKSVPKAALHCIGQCRTGEILATGIHSADTADIASHSPWQTSMHVEYNSVMCTLRQINPLHIMMPPAISKNDRIEAPGFNDETRAPIDRCPRSAQSMFLMKLRHVCPMVQIHSFCIAQFVC